MKGIQSGYFLDALRRHFSLFCPSVAIENGTPASQSTNYVTPWWQLVWCHLKGDTIDVMLSRVTTSIVTSSLRRQQRDAMWRQSDAEVTPLPTSWSRFRSGAGWRGWSCRRCTFATRKRSPCWHRCAPRSRRWRLSAPGCTSWRSSWLTWS